VEQISDVISAVVILGEVRQEEAGEVVDADGRLDTLHALEGQVPDCEARQHVGGK